MAKKILLAAGCSYTEKDYRSGDEHIPEDQRTGWPMWPELMANELDLKCVNTARCGAGSDFILKEIIKGIATYGDRIDTIAVLWSGADRESFYTFNFNAISEIWDDPNFDPFSWMDDIGIGKVNRNYWKSRHFDQNTYKVMLENQLARMLMIIDLCKLHNIKLIMAQGLSVLNYWAINDLHKNQKINERAYIKLRPLLELYVNNPFFNKIEENKKHIVGWPFYQELNGYFFDLLRHGNEEYYISERDRHPNKLGQELFFEEFMKGYRKVYG